MYVEFLTALSRGHSNLRAVALDRNTSVDDRPGALYIALDDAGVWRLRQSLSLAATREINLLAMAALRALEGVRDALIADPDTSGGDYLRARATLWTANAEIRDAMRRDLGERGEPDPELT